MFHIFRNFDISSTRPSLDLSILPLQFRLFVSGHTHTPLTNLFGLTQFYLDTITPFRNTRSHSVRHRSSGHPKRLENFVRSHINRRRVYSSGYRTCEDIGGLPECEDDTGDQIGTLQEFGALAGTT
ncbi:hypothetical protein Hdeb2414_s0007g00230011 [Helianthus debilis subsp. tardiflorus]